MWHLNLHFLLLVLGQTLLVDRGPLSSWAWDPFSAQHSRQPQLINLNQDTTSVLSYLCFRWGSAALWQRFGGNQILEPILAVALEKEKTEKKNCFSNIWSPNIFICSSKSTDHMYYICSGLGFKQGLWFISFKKYISRYLHTKMPKKPRSHRDTVPPLRGLRVFRIPRHGQIPLPAWFERRRKKSSVWRLWSFHVNYTAWLI